MRKAQTISLPKCRMIRHNFSTMKMGTNLALLLARMKAITIMSSLISLVARSHDCALRVFNSAIRCRRQLTLSGFIYVARVPTGSIPAPAYVMEMINSGNTSDNALVTQANACVLQLIQRLSRRCTRWLLCSMLDPTVSYDGRSAVKRRRGFRWEKRS